MVTMVTMMTMIAIAISASEEETWCFARARSVCLFGGGRGGGRFWLGVLATKPAGM
jgi:hypothetical protein